jgi:hypothetical protein
MTQLDEPWDFARHEERALAGEIIQEREPGSLLFLGGPKIGKTMLLRSIQAELGQRPEVCCVWVDATADGPDWRDLVKHIRNAVPLTSGKVVEEALDSTTDRLDFFRKLLEKLPELTFVFLLDDFDKAYLEFKQRGTSRENRVTPPHFVYLGRQANNVMLIGTGMESLRPEVPSYRAIFREQWLRQLRREEADLVIDYLLSPLSLEQEVKSEIFQWVGYHPYLIRILCTYISNIRKRDTISVKMVEQAANAASKSQEVQEFLRSVEEYLDLERSERHPAKVFLKKSLQQALSEDTLHYLDRAALEFLRDSGVIAPDSLEIPELFQESIRERPTFYLHRIALLSYFIIPVSLGLYGLFSFFLGLPAVAKWLLLLNFLPLLYYLATVMIWRIRESIRRIRGAYIRRKQW